MLTRSGCRCFRCKLYLRFGADLIYDSVGAVDWPVAGIELAENRLPRHHFLMEIFMKTIVAMLFAGVLALPSAPAKATVLDLSTMTCKQFVESSEDEIKMVLTWLDGWYNGDEDEAIIDTDKFVANAKKFGGVCAANPTISIVTAADRILGK